MPYIAMYIHKQYIVVSINILGYFPYMVKIEYVLILPYIARYIHAYIDAWKLT